MNEQKQNPEIMHKTLNSEIISTRARKLLANKFKFQTLFTEEIAKLSIICCKDFVHRFGNKFILVSPDLLEGFYWAFSLHVFPN